MLICTVNCTIFSECCLCPFLFCSIFSFVEIIETDEFFLNLKFKFVKANNTIRVMAVVMLQSSALRQLLLFVVAVKLFTCAHTNTQTICFLTINICETFWFCVVVIVAAVAAATTPTKLCRNHCTKDKVSFNQKMCYRLFAVQIQYTRIHRHSTNSFTHTIGSHFFFKLIPRNGPKN